MPIPNDEPFIQSHRVQVRPTKSISLRKRIRLLLSNEQYGILATQHKSQPYTSIVAFAFKPDLKTIIFATPTTTRKYTQLAHCKKVAFQVDDRRSKQTMMSVQSITATGTVKEIRRKADLIKDSSHYLKRFPHLRSFLESPSCALFQIRVVRYFHVTRFQEVSQWIP